MISLKNKQMIDKTCGKLLCCVLAPLVRIIGLLLHLDHSLNKCRIHHIVVAKYYGMGSIIHSTGLLRELKKTYPDAETIYLSRKSNAPLLRLVKHVDRIILLDDSTLVKLVLSTISVIFQLWKLKIDLFLDLEVFSCFSALVSLFSLARNRIGFFSGHSSDYKSFLFNSLIFMNGSMPVRTCYLQLGKAAGVPLNSSSDLEEPNLSGPEAEKNMEHVLAGLDPQGLSAKRIAVNVNASELSFARRWDKKNFADVCRAFAEKGYHVYLVGSPDEFEYVQQVRNLLPDDAPVFNAAGKFPFPEFLLFLKKSNLLLTNDSGIMNMGFLLKIPVLSLWGPGQPAQYHVDSNHTKYLRADIYCSPCLFITESSPCVYYHHPICMTTLKTEEVILEAEKLLANHEPFMLKKNKYDFCPEQMEFPLGMMYNASVNNRIPNTRKEKA